MKPTAVNILGTEYKIEYKDNPSKVDMYERKSLWGQIDYWTRTIRIYDNKTNIEDIWLTLIHEIMHGIGESLKIKMLTNKDNHGDIDILALALIDVLVRNKWIDINREEAPPVDRPITKL